MAISANTRRDSAPWWIGETPIALGAVPDHLPRRANGEPYSESSVYRACTRGCCGVVLRRFRSCGYWATTVEEIGRWQAALTELAQGVA